MLRDIRIAEEVRRRSRRDDELVIRDIAVVRLHDLLLRIKARDIAEAEINVVHMAEEIAHGICNLARRERRRRDLVKKRREQLIIVAVNQRHMNAFLSRELLRGTHAADASTDDDDFCMFLFHRNVPLRTHFVTFFSSHGYCIAFFR